MDGAFSGNVDFSAKGIESSSRALHRLIRSMRMQRDGEMDTQAAEDAPKPMNALIREEEAQGGEAPSSGNSPTE